MTTTPHPASTARSRSFRASYLGRPAERYVERFRRPPREHELPPAA